MDLKCYWQLLKPLEYPKAPSEGTSHMLKGKGKGNAKIDPQAQGESFQRFAIQCQKRQRYASGLSKKSGRRTAPVRRCDDLRSIGGIAVVRKEYLAGVLRSVGCTHQPTAIVMIRPASQLGLRGYESREVHCTLLVRDDDCAQGLCG